MTMKFMEEGLRFGRTWVDRIMGKVDKDQGVANAGKVLGIGDDGQVVPVEQSGGGSGGPYLEAFSLTSAELIAKLKVGDLLYLHLPTYIASSVNTSRLTLNVLTDTKTITGDISTGGANIVEHYLFTVWAKEGNSVYVTHNNPIRSVKTGNTSIGGETIWYTIDSHCRIDKISGGNNYPETTTIVTLYSMEGAVTPRIYCGTNTGTIQSTTQLEGFIIHNS